MAELKPQKEQSFGVTGAPATITINQDGTVGAHYGNGAYTQTINEHSLRMFVQEVTQTLEHVAQVWAVADHFSRDEKLMFGLLAAWQKWAFCLGRYEGSL